MDTAHDFTEQIVAQRLEAERLRLAALEEKRQRENAATEPDRAIAAATAELQRLDALERSQEYEKRRRVHTDLLQRQRAQFDVITAALLRAEPEAAITAIQTADKLAAEAETLRAENAQARPWNEAERAEYQRLVNDPRTKEAAWAALASIEVYASGLVDSHRAISNAPPLPPAHDRIAFLTNWIASAGEPGSGVRTWRCGLVFGVTRQILDNIPMRWEAPYIGPTHR